MKTKFEEFAGHVLSHTCAVCGSIGRYDFDMTDGKVYCRACNGRLA